MMDLWNRTVIAFVGVGAGICWMGWRWARHRSEQLPAVLRGAQRIWTEREFSVDEPVRLVARVDAAWRLATGEVVLVEVKYRRHDKVYRSDVLQLSAQRLVVAASGQSVASWGLVCVDRGRIWSRPRWHRVALMAEREVVEVALRRQRLLAGEIDPRVLHDGRVCHGCGWMHECDGRKRMNSFKMK